jgi:ATP-dependent Clp protease ATP-binding subunit ClpC
MFERFTDRARKVMALANQEAQRFNHEYLGTEHILLGLVKEGTGVGANVLKNLGVDLAAVRTEVGKMIKPGQEGSTIGKLPQTPQAKKVIESAIHEARSLNHNYVGTEHLLLGLLHEQDGVAAAVLRNLGLNLENVRTETLSLLGCSAGPEEIEEGSDALIRRAIESLALATQKAAAEGKGALASELARLSQRLLDILGKAQGGPSDSPPANAAQPPEG